MNYSGNMPDWHQYNTSQTNEVTPSTQNVNSGHLAYIPGVSPSTLNTISLNSEGLNKHQNNTNYNPRNYQSFNNVSSNSAIPNNSPLASMVQMQNCIGHYGSPNTRNPMLDNINASVDPRNTTIGTVNDDIGYRNNQGPFNGPIGHLNGPNCNLNVSTGPRTGPGPIHGSRTNSGPGLGTNPNTGTGPGPMYGPNSRHGPASVSGSGSGPGPGNMGPRSANVGPLPPPGKPGPSSSCIPCKGMCCNSDPNINYQQWEKFGSYQNNGSYRDNVHPSNYQIENRHFGNNCNFRKDSLDGKEVMGPVIPNTSTADHRRNFADYKYHKDHLVHRNYSTSSGMFHNYSMQGYNYSTEHQKYPYPVKEHTKTSNTNVQNSGMLKHQEQNFIAQQKFNNKQFQYQNGNMIPKGISTLNVNANMASSSQNPYFNSQYSRNISTEISHECQETTDNTSMMNRMQGNFIHNSPSQHQVYQQKIAMQKFSIENHLRELGRIPGYQSHPKYKECILRYREILKLQQSSGYQSPVQIPRVATPANTSMPPINLQFDQNGMLINSSYLPDNFAKLQHTSTVEQAPENMDRQNKDHDIVMANEKCQQSQLSQQSEQLIIPQQNEHVPSSCAETFQKQSQFSIHKDYNQNQLKVQRSESHSFNILSTNSSNETMMQQKASKEFANKPDLDVRQFLANWDETDDEEGTTNLPNTILSETTPVVVVSYENIDLSSKTQQDTEVPRKNSFCSNETLESSKDGETNIITAQDCLTISYSASDNSKIPKTSERTIAEGVVKPGSIIHCISNGPDEIPTIHIVDNLEISNILGTPNDQVIQTLEKQKAIPFFRESSNNETMALENTEQQDKDNVHILSANYTASLDNVDKEANIENSNISETTAISMNNQELRVLSTSQKDNLGVSDNMELKKQHSFEESHNPDDISLPDLPECTPISTTLNTPIHSDTEESSQNMEDLSISTNPIEVMQNSPVISFTQLNSENKVKNMSLGTIELEFQKENRYKNNEHTNSEHIQEVGNFELSGNLKAKSSEAIKNKQLKSLGVNAVRKKVCLINGKENDTKILDTCGVLTSMEYELDIRQKVAESEKNSDRDSSDYTHEKEHKSVSRSTAAIKHRVQRSESDDNIGSNMNLSPTVSDNESQASKSDKEMFRRRKIKTLTVSTNTSCLIPSELDLNIRKRAKEATTWEDKCIDKYVDRNLSQKRDADHLKQSKVSDTRKFDDSSSSQGGEHSVCHTTSQYKHHSAAVIKDNVILSDKKTHGITDRIMNEKSPEFPSKMNNTNTKDLSEEAEIRKRASSKAMHESIQSQTSRLLQKDLKGVDGDVRYTAEEMRLLKEYRKKKEKLYQVYNTHDDNKNEKTKFKSHKLRDKICLEQNTISSIVSLNSEDLVTQEEAKGHSCSKSLIKNTDFGIQVANVNLKIKDNDIGKELILGEKSQEHAKDPLEGIKIEINVSCTDRNVKGQEQNKRLLYDDRSLYEIDDSLSYSNTLDCQRKLHAKEQPNSKLSERAHKVFEKSDAMVDVIETNQSKREAEKNLRITIKKDKRTSLEANEEMNSIVPKEACSLISESQSFSKTSRGNILCKDISKADVIKDTNCAIDHLDVIKSKSAISNTATVDANNKVKGKNKPEDDKEGNYAREDNDRVVRMQKQSSTSFMNVSGVMDKEVASVPPSKASVKLPESNFELRNKSLNNLNNLDFKFGKYSELDLDRDRCVVEELDEEECYTGKWKKPKIDDILEDCDMFQSSSGYVNPIFSSIDKLENLHTVPVYTTKDGKISYSPNRKFTYHELMMEARRRESYSSVKKSHYADTWNSYYSSKFRKMNKRKRHHDLSDKKKYEYKNTKCLYDRKKNYSDEFYGKNHVKYKDYIHSIRNDNAIWSDHYKMDKMYSSSDSDDQIIDRSKNRTTEINNSKKDQTIENNGITISKLQKDDIFINELDLESKSKENIADDPLNKDKGMDLEETQMIQFQILDMEENNENCKNANNNCVDDYTSSGQSDIPSTSLQLTQEKQTVEYSVNESSILNDSEITSENVQTVEDKPSNECTDQTIDKIESEEKNVVTKIELLNKASLLDEQVSLCDPERKEDDEKIISKADIKEQETDVKEQKKDIKINVSDSQTFLESENNLENIEDTESNNKSETNDLPTNQVGMVDILEFENDITGKILDSQIDSNNIFNQVSQESLDLERSKDPFNEIVEESEENISEENILECEEEIVQFSEEVEIPNEEVLEEEDNEYLENSNNDNLSRDTFVINQEECDESESQTILIEKTIDQGDNSKLIFVEPIQHQDNIDTNCDQINNAITKEKNLTDFSKTEIYPGGENITNNITDIVSNKGEIEVILSNIEEISVKEIITDNLRDESESNDLPTALEHETGSDQDSFEDKEMHILNTCCSIKNSPVADVESSKDKAEVDEQKEEQIPLEQVPCKSFLHCSDSNIDMKAIPKLVIKKTDTPNSKSACSLDYTEISENCDKYDAKLLSELHPKIPKVIITKNRSRSATPVEIFQKTKSDKTQPFLPEQNDESMDVNNSDFESYTLKYNNCENKVPKVRIKLEDISSKDLKVYLKRKATKRSIPKMRIKKLKTQESKRIETKDSSGTEGTDSDEDKNFDELMSSDTEIERTPKSKFKRQEDRSWSPDKNKGKNSNISKIFSKKTKRTKEEDSKHTAKYDMAISDELKKFPQCIIEKIPKVIIKRTQIGAEFKCEISKSKKTSIIETSNKWQPKVKLQRLDVLDHMAKDLKQSKITLNDKFDLSARMKNINNEDTIDNSKVKLSRSNSVSNLSPAKYKQRRFSDSSYMKVNRKSNIEFENNLDETDNVVIFKSDDSESKNIRKKEKRKIFSESKQLYHSQNNESESEMGEIITKHSFRNILTNEDNDMMVVNEEYSSFDTKDSTPLIEDKFLDAATRSHNYNDNDSSIIKVDSSDESQTTIEILPASPNNSDDEAKNSEFESINRMDMADAMPTQLELELELIDNNNTYSEVFMSEIDYASHSKSKYSNERSTKTFFNEFQRSSQDTFDQNKYTFLMKKQHFERNTNDNFYCNDLLIKEVLAAKETLKKCLIRSETEDVEKTTSRPKTVAEKKQGLSFSFKDFDKSSDKSEETCFSSQNHKIKIGDSTCDMETEEIEENCFKQHEIYSMDCPTVSTHRNSNEPTTISLKSSKTSINNSDLSNKCNRNEEKLQETKSVKKTNSSSDSQKNNDNSNNTKVKEDNMPLLVPEFVLNFDSSSDRDSSRSPPVIINQEEVEHVAEDTKLVENKVISQIEKIEENKKHSYKNCEMTIADIITQLAYHEKVKITIFIWYQSFYIVTK